MEDRPLARIGPTGGGDVRAACKKCGYPGHLTYQCRNFVKVSGLDQCLLFEVVLFCYFYFVYIDR